MKKLMLAAMFCVLGTVAAKAQWFANYTACDLTFQQFCVNTTPCAKVAGPTVTVLAGQVIPVPFAPCAPGQETLYLVCWVNCPGLCAAVSVTPPPQACPVPYSAPLPPCFPCGPATVTADPFSGTVKVY